MHASGGAGNASGGSTHTGGATGTGGAGAGGTTAEAWVRPAIDCTTIGQSCDSTCSPDTTCYWSDQHVCVPKPSTGVTIRCSIGSCPADAQYCIYDFCMTHDQAACFCTAAFGSTFPVCALGPSVHEQPPDAGSSSCVAEGSACPSATGDACCSGLTCVNSTNAELAGCRGACTVNAQCSTGCCLPFSNSTDGFCAPARYCTCGAIGASCGATDPACCDTAQCTVIGTAPAQCLQKCTLASDCSSNCCVPVTGTGVSVCAAASNCG